MVNRLVVDTTDGSDFQQNSKLMLDTIAQADTVTVAYEGLRQLYAPRHPHVVKFAWTIPADRYIRKESYRIISRPILGWMGSPGNMKFVKMLEPQLRALARERSYVLRIICRSSIPLDVPNATVECYGFDELYYQILSTFDIGLCPILDDDIASKGKIAMKHQEFMLCAIPQVCSPWGISEEVKDGETALIATRTEDWVPALLRLTEDEQLRGRLGVNSWALFQRLYTYEGVYPTVRRALIGCPGGGSAIGSGGVSGRASGPEKQVASR
jgi:hypothetical protein